MTWKIDHEKQEVILPQSLGNLSAAARPILNVAGKHLNSLYLSKTGQVYATYVIEEFWGARIFYLHRHLGLWTPRPPKSSLYESALPSAEIWSIG